MSRQDPDGRRWYYKCDGQNGCNIEWVNPNEDGSYTSLGEGWQAFILTEQRPYLSIYNETGTQVHLFGETSEGTPTVSTLWTGKVEDASWDLAGLFIPGRISVKAITAGAGLL